jgi:hypothetical protein
LQVLHLAQKYLPQPRSDSPVNAFPTFVAVVAPAFLLLVWKVLSIIFRTQIHGIKVYKELFQLKNTINWLRLRAGLDESKLPRMVVEALRIVGIESH